MTNQWRLMGIALAAASILLLLVAVFSDSIVPGTLAGLGPVQFIGVILGAVLSLLGISIARQVTDANSLKVATKQYAPTLALCVIGMALNLILPHVYIQGESGRLLIDNLRWAIDWFVLAVALLRVFVWRKEQANLRASVRRHAKAAPMFIQSNYGIIIASVTVVLSLFSDVFRGAVWAYTLFLAMGFGVSLWSVPPRNRLMLAPAFAPIIGFAMVAVFGAWLVMLDSPVNAWAIGYTTIAAILSLVLAAMWRRKAPSWQDSLDWRTATNDIGVGYLGLVLVLVPVAIGGMEFSTFRVNPDDAQTYMSLAKFLAGTRFSLHEETEMLFQLNPAIYLGAKSLATRWSTGMLMSYSSIVAGLPVYRFDFAFSALPFALLMAPIYKVFKATRLGKVSAFFLAIGIGAGTYAQVVLDSRAVSYCTSLPVLLGVVFIIARIWDDKESWFGGWPIHMGEMLLLTFLLLALFVLYPDILSILGLGVLVGALYYIIRRSMKPKKTVLLLVSGAFSILIVYLTLPSSIEYLIGQTAGVPSLYVDWREYYFAWLFNDFPAGMWGLNPYQIGSALSPVAHVYSYVLTALLIAGCGALMLRRAQIETSLQLSGFMMTAGALLFAYLCFRGQYWLAGKAFTFAYPFMMICVAFIPHGLKGLGLPASPAILRLVPQALVLVWLVLLAATSLYRFVVVTRGVDYPFYLGGIGHTQGDYRSVYKWETQRFLDTLEEPGKVVWLASDTVYQDMMWALSMPSDTKVFNTHPIVAFAVPTVLLTQKYLSTTIPDYLIISNSIWRWNNAQATVVPVLVSDQAYSLIDLSRQVPPFPLLIGIRNNPAEFKPYHRDFWVGTEGWLVFLSPGECIASLAGTSLIPKHYPGVNLVVSALPAREAQRYFLRDNGLVNIAVRLEKGYNFVSLRAVGMTGAVPWDPSVYVPSMHIDYNCSVQ